MKLEQYDVNESKIIKKMESPAKLLVIPSFLCRQKSNKKIKILVLKSQLPA
jgi:hypothetical protein